jgi:tripartite-type tricarboxylate transporter receptor subunit TctC
LLFDARWTKDRKNNMWRWISILTIGLGVAAPAAIAQEEAYPSHTVRIIAAAAPGGNPDVLARLLAQRLTEIFGKPFVVENVPGAGGIVAATRVAAAPNDGYVLMINDSGGMAINVTMSPDLTYRPLQDFTPITALATVPTVLVLNSSVPAKTLPEFIALAKSKPGAMSYGSAGVGSIHHLTMAIFAERANIDLLHVPYRGGTAMVNGLLTGEIQAGWSGIPNVISLINTGQLRALCVSVVKRSSSLPDVPACAELGFSGFDVATMLGLQTSAGVSPKIVAQLQSAVAKALREPAMMQRMRMLGIEMQENGTAQYTQFMKDDLNLYEVVVKKLNLQIKPTKE